MTAALELLAAVHQGDRRALAKAITLVESTRAEDRAASRELLSGLGSGEANALRIGVTGVPGAGKSTLIDALGLCAIQSGRRVAVLAVDPSSRDSGGSVLGDKTRMTRLTAEARAFVRPSPTSGVLGGTARRTREAIALCEAAGYDVIFVETVGVGQSEERVAGMVDSVLLLLLAGAGDDISSMKRGVLEAADVIAFNKADGAGLAPAQADAAALRASLGISRAHTAPEVLLVSALEGSGTDELWQAIEAHQAKLGSSGQLAERRRAQRRDWFDAAVDDVLRDLLAQPDALAQRESSERAVMAGQAAPYDAAERFVGALFARRH